MQKDHGDLFLASTANDSWDVLKTILQQCENNSTVLHPINVNEHFFKSLHDISSQEIHILVKFKIGGIGLKTTIRGHFTFT